MKRRKPISLIGGLAIAWPHASYAKQPKQPLERVGVIAALGPCPQPRDNRENLIGFRLRELDWVEGQTIVTHCVSAVERHDQVPALARELISRHPDVLIAGPWTHVGALKLETGDDPYRHDCRN